MAYLYLNFLDNLEKGSRSWDDFLYYVFDGAV